MKHSSKGKWKSFPSNWTLLLGFPISYHRSICTNCSDQKANLGVLLNTLIPSFSSSPSQITNPSSVHFNVKTISPHLYLTLLYEQSGFIWLLCIWHYAKNFPWIIWLGFINSSEQKMQNSNPSLWDSIQDVWRYHTSYRPQSSPLPRNSVIVS